MYTKGDEVGMITPADKSMLCTNTGIVPNSQSQTSWTPTFDVAAANATENMENMTLMASGAKSVSSDTPRSALGARTPLSPRSPNVVVAGMDLSFNSEKAGHTPGTSLSFGSRKKRSKPTSSAKPVVTASRIELADTMGSPVTPAGPTHAGTTPGKAIPANLEMSPEATHMTVVGGDDDEDDSDALSPEPAGGARAPTNTPAASVFDAASIVPPMMMGTQMGQQMSPTASQEDVIEEVKSWFASVHSKLDLALSAISPGGHLRGSKTPTPDALTPSAAQTRGTSTWKSPEHLTTANQSPSTLMGAGGAVARLIEEALAAPDAPVFTTDIKEAAAIESPISAWMARPKALVEALAEPLTPSPSTRGESISAFSAEPLPEDCVTPVATLEDLPGFSADALVVDVSNTDALRVVATLTCAALVGVFPAALALVAISATYGAAVNAFTYLLVPTPATPTLAVIKGSFMIFPPFLARFVAMTETYFCNLGSAMRAVPFDAAAAAAAAEEAERLARIGRVDLTGEGLTILFMLLASFAAVAGAVLFALHPEGDVFRGVREAFTEAVEMSSPAASVANSGDVSWIAGSPEATAVDDEDAVSVSAAPVVAVSSANKTPRGAFMEQVENVSSKLSAIKRMVFAGDDVHEEVRCTAVVDELKVKLEQRNRVARGVDAFPWMSYPPAKSPAGAEVW